MGRAVGDRGLTALALISSLVTIVGSLLLPLAPVNVEEPIVSWPLVPTAPTSTLLPLEAGLPLDLQIVFTCRAVTQAANSPDHVVLATTDPDRPERAQGLRLVADTGTLTGFVGSRPVFHDVVPPGPCLYRVSTSGAELVYSRDGMRLGTSPRPVVDALITAITTLPGPDLSVTVHVDNRFASSPTPAKTALLTLLLLSASLSTGCLLAFRRRCPARVRPLGGLARCRPAAADIVVTVALVAWVFLAPMTHDDGWMYAMARDERFAGYFGNYYMYFNNSYVPFTWLLRIYSWWSRLGISPVLMRVPSLVFALITWAAVRGTLGSSFQGRRLFVPALVFLAWWLPFGLGTRQEASVAACVTVTTFAMVAARRRQQLPYLGLAIAAASLGLTTHPAGAIAVLPILLGGPAGVRLIRRASPTRARAVAIAGCVVSCAAGAGLAGFADGSLDDFIRGQSSFGAGPSASIAGPFLDEVDRYRMLLGASSIGNYALRTPVLLLMLALPFFVMLSAHARRRRTSLPTVLWLSGWTCLLGLGVLVVTPSKWTWHFGAYAGVATIFLSALASTTPRLARTLLADRPALIRGGGSLFLAATVSWVWLSGQGRNWWADTVMPGVPRAGEPLLGGWWATGAVITIGLLTGVGLTTWRSRRSLAPVLTAGLLIGCFLTAEVVFLVGGFGVAVTRTWQSWSPWADAVRDPLAHRCGEARVLWVADPDTASPVEMLSGQPAEDGFTPDRWSPDSPPEPGPATAHIWGSLPIDTSGAVTPRRLSTPWLRLPADLSPRNQLMTTVSGLTGDTNQLTAEYGTPSAAAPDGLRVSGTSHLDDREDDVSWRDATITDGSGLPAGATAFRLTATVTQGRLAFAMPTVRRLVPVADALPRDGRTLVDWQLSWLYPCQGQPPIADGIVAPISYAIGFGFGPAGSRFSATNGGTWTAQVGGLLGSQLRSSTLTRLYTVYSPDPGYPMRTVYRLTRPYADHAYQLRLTTHTAFG